MTWEQFVKWFMEPSAITAALGVLESFVVEWFPKWKDLEPKAKRVWFLGVSMLMPVAFAAIGAACGFYAWSWPDTFWPAIQAGALSFGTGTAAHTRKL